MPFLRPRLLAPLLLATILAACGSSATTPNTQQSTTSPTEAVQAAPAAAATRADLSGIKTYLGGKTAALKQATAALKTISDRYYDLAKTANFDYAALWQSNRAGVTTTIANARAAWTKASPLYEQMEGIVAGTPSLASYDVIIDAGASGADGGENVVPFDLALPDGRVLPKPGNLFGVTESTLWGTFAAYRAPDVQADINGDGAIGFGDALPDANVLKAGVDKLADESAKLAASAAQWQPSEADAFTALVVMVPTMTEYFNSWKNSRFVAGNASQQRDFVAISRLADMGDILSSLEVVHDGVSPLIQSVDTTQDAQINQGLANLKAFVAGVYQKEQSGKHFSPEEADLLGEEAQNRATAITGQVTQVVAKLDIKLEQ